MISHKNIAIVEFSISFTLYTVFGLISTFIGNIFFYSSIYCFSIATAITFVRLRIQCKHEAFEVSWRAALLGALLSTGLKVFLTGPAHWRIFGIYMSVMSFFHFSEFIAIAIIQPTQVSTDSFVLNHSPQYITAAVSSWIEFFIEAYFFPGLKQHLSISYVGLSICVFGEYLRKLAMITAGRNFNHLVQSKKAEDQTLVTTGVYAYFRHPSYVGWFYWAIGTQIILLNPLCIVAYAVVSWMFFNSRIYIEEITLLNFFGQNYVDYQKRVGTGIPYIKGYEI
ncbi:protein-S-isoprenylcysteine O-methyltransferase [Euwallacea similis]|uniref:protein-S-isoprenylcysteine O-methyltransferase n=1 Tax=Euwallacea similis TaxID=1736056 RepID=UPI00345001EF